MSHPILSILSISELVVMNIASIIVFWSTLQPVKNCSMTMSSTIPANPFLYPSLHLFFYISFLSLPLSIPSPPLLHLFPLHDANCTPLPILNAVYFTLVIYSTDQFYSTCPKGNHLKMCGSSRCKMCTVV